MLELKQSVFSGLFYFLTSMATFSGSLVENPLLRTNEVNLKSSRVLGQTSTRDQAEAIRWSHMGILPKTDMLLKSWMGYYG